MSTADKVTHQDKSPKVEAPGDLLSFDVFSLGVPHVHGGQTKVLGINDHFSGFNWVRLLRNETAEELIVAWREYLNFCKMHKVIVRRVHTDNAKAHVGPKMTTFMRDETQAHYSTIVPNEPRQNAVMERQWRSMASDSRKSLHHGNIPRNYCWYALDESVAVANTLPIHGNQSKCPHLLFTGKKPNVTKFRVMFSMMYAQVYDPLTKMANRAVRCIHLGRCRNQPGYLGLDPETGKLHVSVHCRFVEGECPGLKLSKEGWQTAMPSYSEMRYDSAQWVAEEPLLGTEPSIVHDGHEEMEDLVTTGSDTSTQGTTQAASAPVSQRPRRSVANYTDPVPGAVVCTLQDLAATLHPGGATFGTQVLSLSSEAKGTYVLYLCSGEQHEDDLQHWMRRLSCAETYVINVDTMVGGHGHDINSTAVTDRLVKLAAHARCLGVLVSIPCAPWSAARFNATGEEHCPKPLFTRGSPDGLRDAKGLLPLKTKRALTMVANVIRVMGSALSHAAHVIVEHPVARGEGSQFAIPGREKHSTLWDVTVMRKFAATHNMRAVVFDKCRTGAGTQKTTQLMCSTSVYDSVHDRLGHLMCNHEFGTHASVIGSAQVNADGSRFSTKQTERFTSEMNRQLAESFLDPRNASNWVEHVGEFIDPFTNAAAMGVSYLAADMHAATVDKADPMALLHEMHDMARELWDVPRAQEIMRETAPIAAVMCAQTDCQLVAGPAAHLASGSVLLAFAGNSTIGVAAKSNPDNPSYKQAMKGPDREMWQNAMQEEVNNFINYEVFVEVPEDSLPTYDKSRRTSTEVADMMWVLVKKYNELREFIRAKARGTVRGDQSKAIDIRLGIKPSETFAPTVRHTTCKMITAAACVRAHQNAKAGKACKPMRFRTADATAAFLQGKQPGGKSRYVRPPPGYRKFDRRGVPIVWLLKGNCYGTENAPRVWFDTIVPALLKSTDAGGCGFQQSNVDPCYLYKVYPDGSRLDLGLYVDDMWAVDDAGELADADFAIINSHFQFTIQEAPKQFLNMNVSVESPCRVKFTMEAYVLRMADAHVPDWRSWDVIDTPASPALQKAYDVAHQRLEPVTAARLKSYRSKVGALIYTNTVRVDACYAISRLSRAQTFPTAELEKHADRVIVYLAQTATVGVTFDGAAPNAHMMYAESDSDWAVGHSTSGYAIYFGGAAVCYSSKRQPCIAVSSTEAEIIAASACALELVSAITVREELGFESTGPIVLFVDNDGAVELSRDRKSCHRARHVDRRYFKVRELVAEGLIFVERIDTTANSSDVLTKALDAVLHWKHCNKLFNK